MVATKWKVVAGAATVAVALGAGTAVAQTTTSDPAGQTGVTEEESVDTGDSLDAGDSADTGESADTGDSADSPDTP